VHSQLHPKAKLKSLSMPVAKPGNGQPLAFASLGTECGDGGGRV